MRSGRGRWKSRCAGSQSDSHRRCPPRAAGIHDIPEADYFGDTWALSCSGAKLLLPPYCPAKFFWRQDHPERKKVWDFGSGAHNLVLGNGPDIVEVTCDNWMTKAAKQQRDDARAGGRSRC